ncbi:MAG: cbb3-type cytochrome c oxidase subunit II [Planctomycetaceae bacterium]|nr:cbb3-type cytochrome c oxidase subunit II [Planctomycetaceae bacterium]
MFESKAGILWVAGLGFFALAFVSNAVVPALMYKDLKEQTVEELINPNLRLQFEDLYRRYPDTFKEAFGEPPGGEDVDNAWWDEQCAKALRMGHKIYVGEGCWHCHSQFIRPVSNEEERWGPVSRSEEYANELQRPVLFGTRRVGPDLCREGGRRSNDWHAVHFFRPEDLSVGSPMPEYPWLFDGASNRPNARGLAIITYVQWLGSWQESYPYYEDYVSSPMSEMDVTEATTASDSSDSGSGNDGGAE